MISADTSSLLLPYSAFISLSRWHFLWQKFPTESDSVRQMKEIFDDYVTTSFGEHVQASFKFFQFERNYRSFFPKDPDAPLLDVGIGRGEMLSCMKKWGYTNFRGIDISRSTVAFCISLGLPCEQVESTIDWLQDHIMEFSMITLLDVLEHVPKAETLSFLAALRDALLPDGRVIIQVPNMQAPDAQLHRYNDFTHETGFTEHSLRQVLMTAGFSHISIQGFEDSASHTARERFRLFLRPFYWQFVRLIRRLNGNLSPEILNPVFFAIASMHPQGHTTCRG